MNDQLMRLCLVKAARVYHSPKNIGKNVDNDLVEAFATILYNIISKHMKDLLDL